MQPLRPRPAQAPAPPEGFESNLRQMYTANAAGVKSKKQFRHIPQASRPPLSLLPPSCLSHSPSSSPRAFLSRAPPPRPPHGLLQAPERILDAPDLTDDYYLNLLDWGSNNVVSVALGSTVYLWNAGSGDIQQLCQPREDSDDIVTSVAWAADGKHIAVGTSAAQVQIWDASRSKIVRTMRGHSARVSALSWNGTTLATGGRDNNILIHDVRIREHLTNTLRGHDQEVCGLKWSPSGQQLASGANDNILNIWDQQSISNNTYLHQLTEHQAAVKALAWCPFQSNLLASGGGTADRCIKFWNTHTGALQNSIDTHSQARRRRPPRAPCAPLHLAARTAPAASSARGLTANTPTLSPSQVCALQWNTHERELLSSHGYSQNQLCLWKYPTMVKMAEFTGHTARVLHMAQSPDGFTVVSAAADETLRFWRAFGDGSDSKQKAKAVSAATGSLRSINLR